MGDEDKKFEEVRSLMSRIDREGCAFMFGLDVTEFDNHYNKVRYPRLNHREVNEKGRYYDDTARIHLKLGGTAEDLINHNKDQVWQEAYFRMVQAPNKVVIFLDFDGVLHLDTADRTASEATEFCARARSWIQELVDRLTVEGIFPVFVVTAEQRKNEVGENRPLHELREWMIARHGGALALRTFGRTPVDPFFIDYKKGREIEAWLASSSTTNYIIIDDEPEELLSHQQSRVVQTCIVHGFNFEAYRKALELVLGRA